MKKIKNIVSFLLVVLMLFSFASCGKDNDVVSGDNSEVVMSYGDYTLSEKDFMYIVSTFKSQMVSYYQSYLSSYGASYSDSDILEMQMSEDKTIGEYIKEVSIEFAQQLLIFEQLCADSGITITDQSDIDSINNALEDMEVAYGGTDLFEIELARLGITRSAIERYMRANVYYTLVHDYRYGENGTAAIPAESVYEEFVNNYYHYDGALYAYADYQTGEAYTFEFDEEEIKSFFDAEFVKVRHILYKNTDSKNQKLSENEIAEKKNKAESALASIQSGEKTLDDFKAETEDSGYEYVFTYGSMVKPFEEASFEMKVGDVRLVETEFGYHIIEKLEKTEEDYVGKVGEDGKTKGGYKDAAIAAMSAKQIRAEALETMDKLSKGELEKYPEQTDAKKYYIYMKPSFIKKNDAQNAEFVKIIGDIEEGKFQDKEFVSDGTYIIRHLPISKEDITSEIYTSIEDELAMSAFGEYVQSFYDKITVNNELIDKFDIKTLPMLDSNLYTVG
ncbi:MAG: peptidylprolyl isomerase [Clostridia bacterium]|nr:peptidylprolyl isomerase [Clostridia bacterium]